MTVPLEDADTANDVPLQISHKKGNGGVGIKQLFLINKFYLVPNFLIGIMTNMVLVVLADNELGEFEEIFCTDLPNGVTFCLCNKSVIVKTMGESSHNCVLKSCKNYKSITLLCDMICLFKIKLLHLLHQI